jgi:hypothetical protein
MPVAAQTPNTATIDRASSIKPAPCDRREGFSHNTATATARSSLGRRRSSATFPALSLTGTYTVDVSRTGFGDEQREGLTLRSGETAT